MNLTARKNKTKLSPRPLVRLFRLSQWFWGAALQSASAWLTGAICTTHTAQLPSSLLSPALCKLLEDSRKGAQRAQGRVSGQPQGEGRLPQQRLLHPPPPRDGEPRAPRREPEERLLRMCDGEGFFRKGCLKRCYCLGHLLAKNYVNVLLKRSWKCFYSFPNEEFECFKVLDLKYKTLNTFWLVYISLPLEKMEIY